MAGVHSRYPIQETSEQLSMSIPPKSAPGFSRRRFLFTGIAGTAALMAAHWLQPSPAARGAIPASALSPEGADIMRALIPAMLDGALPEATGERRDAVEQTVLAIATAIDGLPPLARDELATLFALLALAPVRIAFAGVDKPWRDASADDASAFLVRLRNSRWSMKRAAYDALHQLTIAAWYANPRAWPSIGYPGPPVLT